MKEGSLQNPFDVSQPNLINNDSNTATTTTRNLRTSNARSPLLTGSEPPRPSSRPPTLLETSTRAKRNSLHLTGKSHVFIIFYFLILCEFY